MNLLSFIPIVLFVFQYFYSLDGLNRINSKDLEGEKIVREEKIKPFKGYSILGNGNVCVVYSDDERTGGRGIQKLYYKNFTASYVQSSFLVINETKVKIVNEDFFPASLVDIFESPLHRDEAGWSASTILVVDSLNYKQKTFVTKDGIVVTRVYSPITNDKISYAVVLNDSIVTDKLIKTKGKPVIDVLENSFTIEWENGTIILFASRDKIDYAKIEKNRLTISSTVNKQNFVEYYLIVGDNAHAVKQMLMQARKEKDLYKKAKTDYENWLKKGFIPKFKDAMLLNYFKRNLYATYSSNLNGMIPADITGQFVTNGMPQLYPRDAMMTARAFVNAGHINSALQVLDFWSRKSIPHKTKGELYARYDAHGLAVDAGSGARFDVPEWDANSYFTILVYDIWKKTKTIKSEHYEAIKVFLDFLETKIDKTGLIHEGGIIEWPGYLPATNMISIVGLRKGAEMCRLFGDYDRAQKYEVGAKFIEANLFKMFDVEINSYIDYRPYEKYESKYLWDTSVNFGPVWGFEINEHLRLTNEFIWKNCRKLENGIQYFDSPDEGLASYGHDSFFFTTSAAAQYYCKTGDKDKFLKLINWMMDHSNIYGLMPERIYQNGEDCSPASPLSWCCAEFVNTLLEGYKAGFFD